MHKSIPSANHSRVTPPADDPVLSSEDLRENSVRKSPELSFSVLRFPNVADQSISAQVLGPDNQPGENVPPQGSNLVDHTVQERLPQTTSPQRSSSPSRDEIESFTLGIIDAPLEKKTGKRKSTDDDEGATIPPKKRQASNLRSTQDSGLADTSATRSPCVIVDSTYISPLRYLSLEFRRSLISKPSGDRGKSPCLSRISLSSISCR